MASSSTAEVESMIETDIRKLEVRVGEALQQLEKDQVSRSDARARLELMSNHIKEEFGMQRHRMNELIAGNNQTSAEHKSGIEALVATFHSQTAELASGIGVADARFDAQGRDRRLRGPAAHRDGRGQVGRWGPHPDDQAGVA